LIVTAGPWVRKLLSRPDFEIDVLRKQQHWFQLDRSDIRYQNGFPAFLIEFANQRCFYGFPEIDYLGMKVAEHTGGSAVGHPGQLNRDCDPMELADVERFVDASFNFTRRRLVHYSVCMYSMSRDGHFIVDSHPDSSRITFAAGLSGHGFKFAPLLGERLVGLLEGESDPMFDFFRMQDRSLQETV
jgi:glycine/D-amino acid oxidase-like deaminating enzyme